MEPYKIFVSSTSIDLGAYRAAVTESLRQRGAQVDDMRDFFARPAEPTEVSVEAVSKCDIFIGIYAFRYGYTPEEGGLSVTEMEYRRAREEGKRCLIFFADETLKALQGSDEPEAKQERLREFKEGIERELVRDSGFNSPEELARRALLSFDKLIDGYLPGYARGDLLRRWAESVNEYLVTFRQKQDLRDELVASPLLSQWRVFCANPPWHARMRSRVETLCHQADDLHAPTSFSARFGGFDWERNYLNLLADLETRITQRDVEEVSRLIKRLEEENKADDGRRLYDLRGLRADLIDARQRIEQPHFQRCFLVRGSLGSGKTHFVASALRASAEAGADGGEPAPPLVLLLEPHQLRPDESLDEFILRRLGEASGLKWASLEEFDRFAGDGTIRLVVALDDIQKWLPLRAGVTAFRDLLKELLDGGTHLHSLYWLLTVQDTGYAELARLRELWGRYSHFNSARRRGRPRRGDELPAPDLPEVDGWVELNELNFMADLGIKLIRERFRPEGGDGPAALDLLRKDEVALHNLSLPFIVWILIGLHESEHLNLGNLATLSYVSLVETFWDKRGADFADSFWSRYDPADNLRTGGLADADMVVRPVARALAGVADFVFTRGALLRLVREAAEGDDNFDAEKFAAPAVGAFVEANLLKTYEGRNPSDTETRTTLLEISFEPFWEYHLARQLKRRESLRDYDREGARLELEKWFGELTKASIKAGVLEFLLLLLEPAEPAPGDAGPSEEARAFLDFLVRLGLVSDALPNDAVWLAGAKGNAGLQGLVARAADGLDERLTLRTLHAFMYFVNGALPSVMSPPERLRLLQPLHAAIRGASLSGYFRYTAKRQLRLARNEVELVSCMVRLDGCETVHGDIARELARLTHERLVSFAEGQARVPAAKFVFELVVKYLRASVEAGQSWRDIPPPEGAEPTYQYLSLVLSEFCEWLTREMELDAYDFLFGHSWYEPEKLGVSGRTAGDMRREVNFALGDWYRRQPPDDRRRYVELVRRLADSPRRRDPEVAFYLIRHSELTRRYGGVRVSEVFRPMLEKIFLDPRQDRLVKKWYRMFEANFDRYHFGRLKERRKESFTEDRGVDARRQRGRPRRKR